MPGIDPPTPYNWSVGDIASASLMNAQVYNGLTFLLNPPLFFGYQATSQLVPNNAFTAALLDSETVDTEGGHSTTTNTSRYTFQRAGRYRYWGTAAFGSSSTGFRGVKINLNGSTAVIGSEQLGLPISTFTDTVLTTGVLGPVSVGDYAELLIYQNTGNNFGTNANASFDYVTSMGLQWISN